MTIEVEVSANDYTCGNCKHYDPDECYCQASGEHYIEEQDTCDEWEEDKDELSEDDLEAQRTDAAEHENHRHETED